MPVWHFLLLRLTPIDNCFAQARLLRPKVALNRRPLHLRLIQKYRLTYKRYRDVRITIYSIRNTPPEISSEPMSTRKVTFSCRKINAKRMVKTMLSLSIGATRDTSPSCNALK